MKKILLYSGLALSMAAMVSGCKKDDDNNNPDPTPTNPYYFNFKANGTAYNFSSATPQYISSDENVIGGFQETSFLTYPSISLSFKYDHHPTESEVLSLAGNTYHFDGSYPNPYMEFDGGSTNGSEQYYTSDTTTNNLSVKVNSISYVKTDTTIFNIVDVYVINGTCNAFLQPYQTISTYPFINVTEGSFNFLISRVK
ncbi:hypothetical protein F0919_09405 [Taibaiella lutea]|uniref:Uncharacterized protein n=1 Tax=Taibaiella lutea TaxID=2608001 RepID=A0A5M6CI79_9BACT|nr:hypothetical protein [Taibaiella lutea]KAA5534814.1 hypothetical protein F0919_09405 [Taibaiella lutea]